MQNSYSLGSSCVGIQLTVGIFERGSVARGHLLPSPPQIKFANFLRKM
jgi:hypothetical protein